LFEQHVADFNRGVTGGDFTPMVSRFDPDGEVVFTGAPFGPIRGQDAIHAAYRDQPPDDTITVISTQADGDTVRAEFVWDANPDKDGGTMELEVANSRIKRLVIALA
jgi:hypothetical protein